jgi:hypothetical protein
LVIDYDVRLCHVLIILVLAVTGLGEFLFPYVGINLGDRDDVPLVGWIWLRVGVARMVILVGVIFLTASDMSFPCCSWRLYDIL